MKRARKISSPRNLILSSLFAALLALMAQISIPLPFSPVPITGQTFGIFLAGALLGGRWGAVSILVYVLLGAIGLPVFHHGQGGLHIILGPTGGYLWGFVIGGYLLGKVAEKKNSFATLWSGMALCLIATYTLGILQLALLTGLSFEAALLAGVAPFILPDIIKVAAAATLSRAVKTRLFKAGLLPDPQEAGPGI